MGGLIRLFAGSSWERMRLRYGPAWDEARYSARLLRRDRLAVGGLTIILAVLILALAAPYVAPFPEQGRGESNLSERLETPSAQHWFGTDRQGRDILSRVLFGARISFRVAFLVTAAAVLIGSPLGAVAGYYGGWVDEVVMRFTDLLLAFPALLLAIAIVAVLGPSLEHGMIAIAVSWWPWYTRLVRGVAVSVRERPYIEAARAAGVSDIKIVLFHVLPNCLTPVVVQATLDVGSVILAAASLSFIGLGAQPPQPEWGLMVSEGRSYVLEQWWYATFPGLAIFVLVLSFNLVGDALRDVLDPRMKR